MKLLWIVLGSFNLVAAFIPPMDWRSVGNISITIGCACFVLHYMGVKL
jgi:hypothetical protein